MTREAWGGIDQQARRNVLEALEGHGEMTARQVGAKVDRHAAAAMQMMYALFDEGLVGYRRVKSRYLWWRTAAPAPERFETSTAHALPPHVGSDAASGWSSAALCSAMHIPAGMGAPARVAKVHRLR